MIYMVKFTLKKRFKKLLNDDLVYQPHQAAEEFLSQAEQQRVEQQAQKEQQQQQDEKGLSQILYQIQKIILIKLLKPFYINK